MSIHDDAVAAFRAVYDGALGAEQAAHRATRERLADTEAAHRVTRERLTGEQAAHQATRERLAECEASIQRLIDEAVARAVDLSSARVVLSLAGFRPPRLGIGLGVSYGESWSARDKRGGYRDAVGDVTLVDDTWGPSIGLFQVRSLREPYRFGETDRYRQGWALLDPLYNAVAAYAISDEGRDWSKWSVYRSGAYKEYAGKDYTIRSGHERAAQWNAGAR